MPFCWALLVSTGCCGRWLLLLDCTVVCKRCRTTSKALGIVAGMLWRNGAPSIYDGHTLRWFVKQGSLLMRIFQSNVRTRCYCWTMLERLDDSYDCSFGVFRFNLRKVLLVRGVGGATPPSDEAPLPMCTIQWSCCAE